MEDLMNTNVSEQTTESAISGGERLKELEFQVSSVLNRLEEAVEKFDGKSTVTSLPVSTTLSLLPKNSQDIIQSIQNAIVNLNLSKEEEEPNLAILPALREVDRLALVTHSLKHYIFCLDEPHSEYLFDWMHKETTSWLKHLFWFQDCEVYYDDEFIDSTLKLLRLILINKYDTFQDIGFEAFKDKEPVIYCNTSSALSFAQYLCVYNGLPNRFVHIVPSFSTDNQEELEAIDKIIEDDVNRNKVPVLFILNIDTPIQPYKCSVNGVRDLCQKYDVWLHVFGRSAAVLPLLPKKAPANQSVEELDVFVCDSISIMLGSWLNVPALSSVTLCKPLSHREKLLPDLMFKYSKKSSSLPLWATIQCIGQEGIVSDLKQKFESCHKLYGRLEKYSCLKMLSQPPGEEIANSSFIDLITKPASHNYVFQQIINRVTFKFIPENYDMWPTTYCDKLNSWLHQIIHREIPIIRIEQVDMNEHGIVLQFSPFDNTPMVPDEVWDLFYACLEQQLAILKSTVSQKKVLYDLIARSSCLRLVEMPEWAGLGGVRFVPEGWMQENAEEANKSELNRLNLQIVQQLRNTDSAFSVGESKDGYACIRFGMIGWDSDVADLINLVESTGKREEESWNFIDTMAEVVKKGIETATLDLQKETEAKLWQEGILRHVPVFGNLVNWWSPLDKDDGVKGRSLDLTAGVIASTESIYRRKVQGASPELEKPADETTDEGQ